MYYLYIYASVTRFYKFSLDVLSLIEMDIHELDDYAILFKKKQ